MRVSGSLAGDISSVQEVFGKIEPISIPGVGNEFGFVTEEMSEREYREKAAKIDSIISMIRARF